MKSSIVILLFVFTTSSFAQQTSNSILNYKKSANDLSLPYSSNYSLNKDFFKLEALNQNTSSLSKFLRESYNHRVKPSDNMPIFVPEGKFFLEIYEVEKDIDYKLKIFQLEKSKYSKKSMG